MDEMSEEARAIVEIVSRHIRHNIDWLSDLVRELTANGALRPAQAASLIAVLGGSKAIAIKPELRRRAAKLMAQSPRRRKR